MGYRVVDLRALRRRFRQLLQQCDGPLLLCPNHLTMIDSAILAWALVPPQRYLTAFRLLPWNTPERENFRHPLVRLFCYLAKCLPIARRGDRHKQRIVLAKCEYLLRQGEPLMIFPEGRRSRSGRVDPGAPADGVGRLVKSTPGCRVLCLYLRGERQVGCSTVPARGESFRLGMELIIPRANSAGVRASRQIAALILETLASLENAHFAVPARSTEAAGTRPVSARPAPPPPQHLGSTEADAYLSALIAKAVEKRETASRAWSEGVRPH